MKIVTRAIRCGLVLLTAAAVSSPGAGPGPAPAGGAVAALTFNRDIAPLLGTHCASCHRPGGAGPFDLLTYADSRRHLPAMLRALHGRVMPPWLPEQGFGEFAGDRRLDERTIATFQTWADQGAPEGDAAEAHRPPAPPPEWALGKPDLVLRLPEAYTLAAEGEDLYHTFVLPPTGLDGRRFVRAVEFHPGNARVVHHAFLLMDSSGDARRRSDRGGGLGYDGMDPGDDAFSPPGHNIAWQPGRAACFRTDDEPWLLPADADVLLNVHMRRRGKPEAVRPEVGLYFTGRRPSDLLFKLTLRSTAIDIPAGSTTTAVENGYTLPVDAEALTISAHAHYLGRDVHAYADLPAGGRVELLRITRWNFNMQEAYVFKSPVALPKGATIRMRWQFDNSDGNPMNPSRPPRRVEYGMNSTDEMAELNVQLRLRSADDRKRLADDYMKNWAWPDAIAYKQNRLRHSPNDATLHVDLAKLYMVAGRAADMQRHLDAAFKVDRDCPPAYFVVARLLAGRDDMAGAAERYRRGLARDPDNFRARGDLGLALGVLGQFAESAEQFRAAIKLNPRDAMTHANFGRVLLVQGKREAARAELGVALRLDPEQALAREAMKSLESGGGP